MLVFYKKTLLVSQYTLSITQLTEIYQELDNIIDNIIKQKGKYLNINKEIHVTVVTGHKTLNKYTCKIDSKTLILYVALVLNLRVKTYQIKAHLEEEDTTTIINQLCTHFKEILLIIPSPSYT